MSRAWLPLRPRKQGLALRTNHANPWPKPRIQRRGSRRRLRRRRRSRLQNSGLPLGMWVLWNLMLNKQRCEIFSRQRVDICHVQEHRWKGSMKPASLRRRTASSSSSTVHKSRPLEELVYCWQKDGQTKLLKSSASLKEPSFSNWSSARQFSPSSVYMHLIRTNPKLSRNVYDELQHAVAKVPATEILIPVGDWNDHISAAASVYSDAHSGHSFSARNAEGYRVLEFATDTWFKKRDSHLITYNSSGHVVKHVLLVCQFVWFCMGIKCTDAPVRVQFLQHKIQQINRPTRHALL